MNQAEAEALARRYTSETPYPWFARRFMRGPGRGRPWHWAVFTNCYPKVIVT